MTNEERLEKAKIKAREWRAKNVERHREYCKKWKKDHPEYCKEYDRKWYEGHRENHNVASSKWRKSNKVKVNAYNHVHKQIPLKENCEVCGGAATDRHHPDYSKPLEVVHLCKTCHAREHQAMRAS